MRLSCYFKSEAATYDAVITPCYPDRRAKSSLSLVLSVSPCSNPTHLLDQGIPCCQRCHATQACHAMFHPRSINPVPHAFTIEAHVLSLTHPTYFLRTWPFSTMIVPGGIPTPDACIPAHERIQEGSPCTTGCYKVVVANVPNGYEGIAHSLHVDRCGLHGKRSLKPSASAAILVPSSCSCDSPAE